mmetsp:Transcript_20758/g.50930  ORF Transcript_20758/g.50930 Transcript_20758/m.50930 type:complete len:160 (-) Transcript_20758:259-738(-)
MRAFILLAGNLLVFLAQAEKQKVTPLADPDPFAVHPVMEGVNMGKMVPVKTTMSYKIDVQPGHVMPIYIEKTDKLSSSPVKFRQKKHNRIKKAASALTPEMSPDPKAVNPVMDGVNNDKAAMRPVGMTTKTVHKIQNGFVMPIYYPEKRSKSDAKVVSH